MPPSIVVVDAIRISDGSLVVIKKSEPSTDLSPVFHEDRIFRKFSTEPLASDPTNHCIRLVEVLPVPDNPKMDLIVMPLLYDWDLVDFLTIGEVVEFFSQVFEGLKLMHNNHIWHGDIKFNNILMDASPLFVEDVSPWRPKMSRDLSREARYRNRTEHPVKYYLIDFDLSGVYNPSAGPPLMLPGYGGTRGVPEFKFQDQQCNPFAVDVWCLGNFIKKIFTEGAKEFSSKKKAGFRVYARASCRYAE